MNDMGIKNLNILLKYNRKSYIQSIYDKKYPNRLFDIIVIDDLYRLECAKQAILKLKNNGTIILDNSELNMPVITFLKNNGFYEIPFVGNGPINSHFWNTSFFRRK